MDVAAVEEDVDRAQRVLLAEAQAAEAGDADLRAEQREAGHQGVGAVRAAQLVGGVGHRAHLAGLGAQARVDVLRRRSVQDVGPSDLSPSSGSMLRSSQPSRQASLRIAASWPRRSSRPRWEKSVFDALLHHSTAVLDPPLRHRHVADGGQDVGVEPGLALLHRPRLLAALDAVLEVLLAEHPDRAGGADVGAGRRLLLGVQRGLGLGEDLAGLLLGVRPAQHALPRLALAGRGPEITWYLLPPDCRGVEPNPPRPRRCRRACAACPARAASACARVATRPLLGWMRPGRIETRRRSFVHHSRASLEREMIHVPLVRSHGKWPTASPRRRAPICSNTRRIRWIGGSGDPRHSPRRSAVIHQSCCRVGYAACHWCHVMAHESFEDEATAAYMNEHYVSIKVDREERPDVDAVYMQATAAMTGQGGWPMTCVLDHEGSPFFAGTYFPDQPRHGSRRSRRCCEAIDDAWTNRARRGRRVRRPHPREHLTRSRRALGGGLRPGGARRGGDRAASGVRRGVRRVRRRAEVPAVDGAGVPAARADGVGTSEARCGWPARRSRRWPRGGIHDQLAGGFARYGVDRAGWCRTSRRCSTTTRSCCRSTPHWAPARRRGGRRGGPRDRAISCCPSCAPTEGAFASALDADSEGEEGTFYVWTPAQLVEVLGADDGAWAASAADRDRARHVRARQLDPAAARASRTTSTRWESVRAAPARGARRRGCGPIATTRSWRPGTGSRSAASSRRAPCSVEPELRRGRGAVRRVPGRTCTCVDGRLLRVSRDGVAGSHAGVLEDYGCVASGFLVLGECHRRRASGSSGRVSCSTPRSTHFRAEDGGFHDTADDAEALVARPRDPSRQRLPERPLGGAPRAARRTPRSPGRAAHRDAAERGPAGHAPDRRLAHRASPAGLWPRPRPCSTVRSRSPSSVHPEPERDALEHAARRHAPWGRWSWSPRRGRASIPLMADRDLGRRPPRGVRLPPPGLPAPGHLGRGAGGAARGLALGCVVDPVHQVKAINHARRIPVHRAPVRPSIRGPRAGCRSGRQSSTAGR